MATTTRNSIKRLSPDDEGMPRYLHPNGYVIVKERRTWSERGGPQGVASSTPPLYWWTVLDHAGDEASVGGRYIIGAGLPWRDHSDHPTLTEARAWCDANPRKGWNGVR